MVASTITANGVATSADASFAVINANIASMVNVVGATRNIFTQLNEPSIKDGIWIQTDVPYANIVEEWGGVFNAPIQGNAISWSDMYLNDCLFCVLNGELYGCNGELIKWNGSSWVSISNGPEYYNKGYPFFVYNNEIHLFCRPWSGALAHYKWNGSGWVFLSNPPFSSLSHPSVGVYRGEIHAVDYDHGHYKWNGSSWIYIDKPDVQIERGSIHEYAGEMYVYCDNQIFYKWNGSTWIQLPTINSTTCPNQTSVFYNGEIYTFESYKNDNGEGYSNLYKWNGYSWVNVLTFPFYAHRGTPVVWNGSIYLIAGLDIASNSQMEMMPITIYQKEYNDRTVIIERNSFQSGAFSAGLINTSRINDGIRYTIPFNNVWYRTNGGIYFECPIYCGTGNGWYRIK